jgi:hypothetical protein
MRFKVDENLPKDAVALLCAAGHPAISAHGQRMSGAEDRTLFEVCRSEHRGLSYRHRSCG